LSNDQRVQHRVCKDAAPPAAEGADEDEAVRGSHFCCPERVRTARGSVEYECGKDHGACIGTEVEGSRSLWPSVPLPSLVRRDAVRCPAPHAVVRPMWPGVLPLRDAFAWRAPAA